MYAFSITLHVLAAIVWIGGMFFAIVVARPAMVNLEPSRRLSLWAGLLKRFFPWVWMAVLILLVTGYWMLFGVFGGFARAPVYVHVMHLLGLIMILLFIYLYYRIYPLFKASVASEDWPAAGAALNRIRHVVLMNLIIGLVLVAAVLVLQKI